MEKYTYELLNWNTPFETILRSDGAVIPKNEANSDYRAYLESLEL